MAIWTAYGEFLAPWSRRGVGRDGRRSCRNAPRHRGLQSRIWQLRSILSDGRSPRRKHKPARRNRRSRASTRHWRYANGLASAGSTPIPHRIRGDILFKRDPANTAPAEEAFLTAIAVAQQQKARSFELRAALSLAKLYQSTGRAADAHAVLAPALEGFSPTPEFPEIDEAQTLLAVLAETDEVKNSRRLASTPAETTDQLRPSDDVVQGFGSEETKTAFARAQELAAGVDNAAERFTVLYGLWVSFLSRGEFAVARETAETFRREAENEAGATRRWLPAACWV